MRIDVLTLFPAMFTGPMNESILRRAQDEKIIELYLHDLRQFGIGRHRQVDDSPYGGGAGMVFRVDVIANAIESVMQNVDSNSKHQIPNSKKILNSKSQYQKPYRIYLSPRGKKLTQSKVEKLAKKERLILLCGHYEGIDQRVIDGGWIDEEISIGDYVLTGGEIPAMVLIDAVARQLPGVLGQDESAAEESFSKRLNRRCEYPHYTRPEEFRGLCVPSVLMSGDHARISSWRQMKLK